MMMMMMIDIIIIITLASNVDGNDSGVDHEHGNDDVSDDNVNFDIDKVHVDHHSERMLVMIKRRERRKT